jgi:hypothetical protein
MRTAGGGAAGTGIVIAFGYYSAMAKQVPFPIVAGEAGEAQMVTIFELLRNAGREVAISGRTNTLRLPSGEVVVHCRQSAPSAPPPGTPLQVGCKSM